MRSIYKVTTRVRFVRSFTDSIHHYCGPAGDEQIAARKTRRLIRKDPDIRELIHITSIERVGDADFV